jgi:hypothetical protein
MKYLLGFDKMVSPIIIRVVYFLLLIVIVIRTIMALFQGEFLEGIGTLVGGALSVRISCEMMILMFRIHDNLVEINQNLRKNGQP